MKIIGSFILLLASLLAGALSPSRSAFAMGAFETTGNVRWVVFASRQNLDEAIGLARRFGSDFGPPMVFSSTSGWYAIVAGPLSVYDPAALKKRLADLWWPPKDTSLAKGQTLVEEVWKAPGSPVLATASSATGTHVASARGLDVRVHTRRDISVRTSGHEMIKVKFDDDGPNTSAAVEIVQLDSSSPFPQVVATHFTGGAHCCTVMKVLTFVGNRWETIDVGEFDSEGPQIEDLLGNGSAELVGKDESFDYTFASYADSNAPPKVFRLAGDRILDVSHSAEFRRPILQMLLADQGLATPDMWRNNGYLAGWVAHSALVGNGAEAWSKMLNLYDRNSDWDLSTCAKDDNPCPDYEKRQRDFPTALREHLAQTGYSLDSVASASVGATSPSFDCNKAQTPSEIQICRSPRLAELDNILAAGYAFIKTTQGRPAADEIGVWYWELIAHCEGGEDCMPVDRPRKSQHWRGRARLSPCRHGRRRRLRPSSNRQAHRLCRLPRQQRRSTKRSRRSSRMPKPLLERDSSSRRMASLSPTPTWSRIARTFASPRTNRRRHPQGLSRATRGMTSRY